MRWGAGACGGPPPNNLTLGSARASIPTKVRVRGTRILRVRVVLVFFFLQDNVPMAGCRRQGNRAKPRKPTAVLKLAIDESDFFRVP